MTCTSCGAINPAEMNFCGACGAPLRAVHPRADDGEYRQLTVLFCDLVDSTGLSERLGPERFREVVGEYHTACTNAIRGFGGHVAQYLGDGLLVYFGYPQAHEDDARRAVHSGLEIVRGVLALNDRLERERGVRLATRIGVHTGPVVAGVVGAGARSEQLAMGQTPNIAARLQALARPDTVVISATTEALVRGFFACDTLGPQALRGVSREIEAYHVRRATGVRSRFELALAKGLTPSVNRHQEVDTLLAALTRVRGGDGQIVWVVGDAGIGKSRLLQMFYDRATVEEPVWALCRCTAYAQHSAFHPVLELLEHLFAFEASDDAVARRAKLGAALATYAPNEGDAPALLGALLSLPAAEGAPALNLAPERQRERTLEILSGILLRMAQRRPLVLGVEDLHWADPSTLEFLGRLIQHGPPARILMLLSHRPPFTTPWSAAASATHIALERLSEAHVRLMVEHLAGDKRLPDEVHRYILEKTDGVPIFVEELTRAVLESGWLVDEGAGYTLARPLNALAIPVTLQDLLLARLDRLGAAKDLALLGSVLGREFSYALIHALASSDEPTLRRELAQLTGGGILYQFGEPPDASYMFRHALIQDAAYGLLLGRTRQQHHRRVAETLAKSAPEILETRPEVLAHHFTEAQLPEPAVGYWLRAARRAVERSANVEATGHVSQGLALLDELPPGAGRDVLELGLQSTLGSASIALKGYGAEEVSRSFGRALELCERVGNPAQRFRAELGLWTYYVVRADYARALTLADRLLAMARVNGAPAPRVHAAYCAGFSRLYVGQLQAAHDAFAEGAAIACTDGDPGLALPTGDDVRIHLLAFAGLVLWHLGRPDEAVARCDEAVALARRLAHPFGVAFALNAGGFLALHLGDEMRAKAAVSEFTAIASDKGYRYFLLLGGFMHGWVLAQSGALDDGLRAMERSIGAARSSGARMGQTLMMVYLAATYLGHGRIEAARTQLDAMSEALTETDERFFEPDLHRLRGECDLADGRAGAAAEFHQAIEIARRHGDRAQELRAMQALARLA